MVALLGKVPAALQCWCEYLTSQTTSLDSRGSPEERRTPQGRSQKVAFLFRLSAGLDYISSVPPPTILPPSLPSTLRPFLHPCVPASLPPSLPPAGLPSTCTSHLTRPSALSCAGSSTAWWPTAPASRAMWCRSHLASCTCCTTTSTPLSWWLTWQRALTAAWGAPCWAQASSETLGAWRHRSMPGRTAGCTRWVDDGVWHVGHGD